MVGYLEHGVVGAAAGNRLALQLILENGFNFYSFQLQDMDACVVVLVTTSLCQEYVICTRLSEICDTKSNIYIYIYLFIL